MDLQTLIVAIVVGVAATFVLRTFTRQFTSRDRKGCGSCAHGGSVLTGQSRQSSASRDDELIQVEPIQVEESIRE